MDKAEYIVRVWEEEEEGEGEEQEEQEEQEEGMSLARMKGQLPNSPSSSSPLRLSEEEQKRMADDVRFVRSCAYMLMRLVRDSQRHLFLLFPFS